MQKIRLYAENPFIEYTCENIFPQCTVCCCGDPCRGKDDYSNSVRTVCCCCCCGAGVRMNILTVYVHCVVVFCCGAGVRMNILTVFVQCVVVVDVVQGSG